MSLAGWLIRSWLFLVLLLGPGGATGWATGPESPGEPGLAKKQIKVILAESLTTLNKAREVLLLTTSKLPDLVPDNREFRRMDRQLEICREDVYPAVAAVEKLKDNPDLLRDAVRLYVSMRILEQHLLRLSDHVGAVHNVAAAQLSTQIFDAANRVGKTNLKLQPYFYKLVDAYQAAAPESRVDEGMQWQETQGPVL